MNTEEKKIVADSIDKKLVIYAIFKILSKIVLLASIAVILYGNFVQKEKLKLIGFLALFIYIGAWRLKSYIVTREFRQLLGVIANVIFVLFMAGMLLEVI